MASTASSAAWLPAALARAVVPQTAPAVRPARHAAAEASGRVEIVSAERLRPDRHAESAWSRELFDPVRDEDPFEWLGFLG